MAFSRTSKAGRIALLRRLHDEMLVWVDALRDATIEEYGAPVSRASWMSKFSAQSFLDAAQTLEAYDLNRPMGSSMVVMEAVGVTALITPGIARQDRYAANWRWPSPQAVPLLSSPAN